MNGVLVRLEGGGFYLNLGDADASAERGLVGQISLPKGQPRILKLSHHGSRYSGDPKFLNWVRPQRVWVSAGAGNPHGHPSRDALAPFLKKGVPILRTDRDGDLSWIAGE